MPSLSISIVAHPRRAAHVEAMLERLRAQARAARDAGLQVIDPQPFLDVESRGVWWNTRRSIVERPGPSSHHLSLEDDVSFCADLPAAAIALADARPLSVVALYYPRGAMERAYVTGQRWVSSRTFYTGVAVLMPSLLADDWVEWCDRWEGTAVGAGWNKDGDVRLHAFLKAKGKLPIFATAPSLVEHVGHVEGIGSILGHHGPVDRRRARWYVGDEAEAAGLGWADLDCVKE